MSAFWSLLFHRDHTQEGAGKVTRTSRLPSREGAGHERRMASSTGSDRISTGLAQLSGGPLFVGLQTLTHRPSALVASLTPVPERAAVLSFVGTGSQPRIDTMTRPGRSTSSD